MGIAIHEARQHGEGKDIGGLVPIAPFAVERVNLGIAREEQARMQPRIGERRLDFGGRIRSPLRQRGPRTRRPAFHIDVEQHHVPRFIAAGARLEHMEHGPGQEIPAA